MTLDAPVMRAPLRVRRPITSVFIDLVGSTPLSVLLDDDAYNTVIMEYRQLVGEAVRRHGGTVQRDEGDGRFVWFGWPAAHRDDADRAVAMALELFGLIEPLAERVRALVGFELALRVGIHTGPQIVTMPRGDEPPDVQGGAVNFAAKVQQHCEPGALLISEATVDILTRPFELVPSGEVTVDSLSGGIRVYRVTGPGEARADRSAFVGRERELAVLCDRWQRVAHGGGAAIVIEATAGLGKSRLIEEFCTRVEIPLVIHATGDERRMDDPLRALKEALGRSGLAAVDDAVATVEDVIELFALAAAGGPTLLVVDDAQWLDASSREVIGTLMRALPDNLMVLVAGRPGGERLCPPDDGDTLRLGPLDAEAAASLVDSLVDLPEGSSTIGVTTRATICDRSGGNPLFLLWLARTSSDADFEGVRRILRPRSGVPVVVQQVLRSVLDDTGVDDMTTATAATIGTEFDAALLAVVLDRSQDSVDEDLQKLAQYEIIRYADGRAARFRFSHALVRDLAYDLLVDEERVRRHAAIANVLEALQPSEHALIGFHLDRGHQPERAARAKLRAARACRASGGYREGRALVERAIELMAAESEIADVQLQLEADELQHLFATATDAGAYTAGARPSSALLLDALSPDDQARWTCMTKTSEWAAACMAGDLAQSARLLYDVYRIGARSFPAIVPFNQCARGYHAALRGRFGHAESLLRTSTRRMVERGVDPWMAEHWPAPDDPIALGLAYLPTVLLQRGYMRSGIDVLARAWQRAETLENGAYSMAHVSLYSATFWAALGDGPAVVEHGRDMTKLGQELDVGLWVTLGGVYEQMGEALADPSHEHAAALGELAALYERFSGTLASVLFLYAAMSASAAGDRELTGRLLDGVTRLSEGRGLQQFDPEAARLRALASSDPARTELLQAAAALAHRRGARRYRLRALADLVEHDPSCTIAGQATGDVLRSAIMEMPERDGDPDVRRAIATSSAAR